MDLLILYVLTLVSPSNTIKNMKQKHLKILEIIFKRPVSGNVKWNDAVSMLKAYGAKIDDSRAGSRVHIALKGNDLLQHRPHPMPTMDKGAVEALRKFLNLCGILPKRR